MRADGRRQHAHVAPPEQPYSKPQAFCKHPGSSALRVASSEPKRHRLKSRLHINIDPPVYLTRYILANYLADVSDWSINQFQRFGSRLYDCRV